MKGSGFYNEKNPTHTFDYDETDYQIILDITGDNGCSCYDSSNTITTSWPLSAPVSMLNSQLSVFPNPTTGVVNLTRKVGYQAPLQIFIRTGDGRLVHEASNISWMNDQAVIDISQFAEGVYYIEAHGEQTNEVHRVVLVR